MVGHLEQGIRTTQKLSQQRCWRNKIRLETALWSLGQILWVLTQERATREHLVPPHPLPRKKKGFHSSECAWGGLGSTPTLAIPSATLRPGGTITSSGFLIWEVDREERLRRTLPLAKFQGTYLSNRFPIFEAESEDSIWNSREWEEKPTIQAWG